MKGFAPRFEIEAKGNSEIEIDKKLSCVVALQGLSIKLGCMCRRSIKFVG